jgi:hypothetical protein
MLSDARAGVDQTVFDWLLKSFGIMAQAKGRPNSVLD